MESKNYTKGYVKLGIRVDINTHTHAQSSNTHAKSICHLSDQTSSLPLAYSSVLFEHRCVFVDCLRSLAQLQASVKKKKKRQTVS